MIKDIEQVKVRIQGAIKKFGIVLIATMLIMEGLFILQMHTWAVAVISIIMIFCFFGLFVTLKAMLYLTSCDDEVKNLNEDELMVKFIGVDSLIFGLWIVVPIWIALITGIYSLKGLNILHLSDNPIMVGACLVVTLLIMLKESIYELAISLFFIRIVKSITHETNQKTIEERQAMIDSFIKKKRKH